MKKILLLSIVLLTLLSACAKKDAGKAQNTQSKQLETLKVASHTNPMTTILELIKDDLKEAGYDLQLVKVTDNVQANVALNNKEVDANFFQHEPFMQQFNQGNNASLVRVTPVYNAIVSYYSKDLKDIKDLKDNATVSIPNDVTNQARALRLLSHAGLIELDQDSYNVKIKNIVKNPKNLKFKEWGLLNLNEAYQESDLTFNYPTYIEALGLTPEKNGLIFEAKGDQTFAISLVARKDNLDSPKIVALKKAINSEKVREFINTKLKGHAVASF